jgi:hypothetical protein
MTLAEFFGGQVPDYVLNATERSLTIHTDTGLDVEITPDDVAEYFNTKHGMSGIRSFATIIGDWRMMHELATFSYNYFQAFNPSSLEEAMAQEVQS